MAKPFLAFSKTKIRLKFSTVSLKLPTLEFQFVFMKLFFTILMIFTLNLCLAQQNLNGYWKGKITHEDGGYIPEYTFELFLIQKGDSITGRSYVYVDSIYAEMNLRGQLHSGVYLEMKDELIIDHQELLGMEWCIKKYQLMLKERDSTLHLEGHWQGETSFSDCIPGRIYLKKKVPRA